ncbi:septum formation family protein [Dactylosporangium sp. NPDC051484]|uniref:septum formation family protein n=1 Tax=Dactylosporangium sp. NPDC051484 TaxID=3154942 RepID=UPI0034508DDD
MRHIAFLAAIAALLAGCSTPSGTDGDLTNGWAAQPAPSEPVPAAGSCLTASGKVVYGDEGDPVTTEVDCATPHKLEVVKTGRFPDDISPPGWGSKAMQSAYADCGKAASEYTGADWHTGWLFVHIGRPSTAAWAGGARTYVCGLVEGESTNAYTPAVERTGSLKGALAAGTSPVVRRCAKRTGVETDAQGFYKRAGAQRRIDCAAPHDAEFAGAIGLPPGPYPSWAAQQDYVLPRCVEAVAGLFGLSEPALRRRGDVKVEFTHLDDETEWLAGEHVSICYAVVASTHPVRGSLKGIGTGPLPV